MEKSPHVERMEAELTELSDRLTKLSAFIGGNEVFATLPGTDQELLKIQRNAMLTYEATLTLRLRFAVPQ